MRASGVSLGLLVVLLLTACDDPDEPSSDAGTPVVDAGPGMIEADPLREDCDALVTKFCAYPFPSDYWIVADPSTPSGRRVNFGQTTLPYANVRSGAYVDPRPFNERDGWSINTSILTLLEEASATGLPASNNIARSLDPDSPTVLLEADTGIRVPHFSEIDATPDDPSVPRTLIIRPVVPLEHNTRYLVAIRAVVSERGTPVEASETFAALRDDTPSAVPSIEARREHFETIFTSLTGYGVERSSLQLAWDFTTASFEDDTRWLISARDQALEIVGAAGPAFVIDEDGIEEFTPEENAHTARRIYGHMTVPNFMSGPNAGATLNLGADGLPEPNGTADYRFVVNIPRSASPATPVKPLQYGHGLFGAFTQANSGWLSQFGNENGFATFGIDLLGMSEEDVLPLTISLANGRLDEFETIGDRLIQGLVNSLLAMRMMMGGFGQHEALVVGGDSIIDGSEGFYTGDSQGGIFGGTYMAITTDVRRGVLGVPGQPYSLLLNRSVDFDAYRDLLKRSLGDGPAVQLGQALIQMLWDRTEPGAYTSHIRTDMFPGTPAHEVLLQPAVGDHQVTTLAAHVMARAIGGVGIEPMFRPIWGIDAYSLEDQSAMGPYVGSAMVEFDFGLNEPIENVPVRTGDDPHGQVRRNPRALEQSLHFFRTGEIIHTCDGPCDPE